MSNGISKKTNMVLRAQLMTPSQRKKAAKVKYDFRSVRRRRKEQNAS